MIQVRAQPALAASLRMTDQARERTREPSRGRRDPDSAARDLDRPSNPYAYFYLGRAYREKNYDQAMTFFKRAEIGFGANPAWLGETLAFEGLANEQSGPD